MTAIDPRRLARSLSLDVEPLDAGDAYRVTGGREAHVVRRLEDSWMCDCVDSRYHRGPCKHRIATHLARRLDHRVREALRQAVERTEGGGT